MLTCRVVQGEVFKNSDYVFVRGEDTPIEAEPKDFWVARILQVRAQNSQHVYALVSPRQEYRHDGTNG